MSQPALFSDLSPASLAAEGQELADGGILFPPSVAAHIWKGSELGARASGVVPSGHLLLDSELPGGGWPRQSLTELLLDAGGHCEWRLLAPALRRIQAQQAAKNGAPIFLIGAPHTPHVPGLRSMGLDENRLVWVKADTPRERLWAAQQVIKSTHAAAVLAWLPQVDARALRRLQSCTPACDAPVFVFRPASAREETSPAPLRIEVGFGEVAWALRVRIWKRRGPLTERELVLPSVPGGLTLVLARGVSIGRTGRKASGKVCGKAVGKPLDNPLNNTMDNPVHKPLHNSPELVDNLGISLRRLAGIPVLPSRNAVDPRPLAPLVSFPAAAASALPQPVADPSSSPAIVRKPNDVLLAGALVPPLERALAR